MFLRNLQATVRCLSVHCDEVSTDDKTTNTYIIPYSLSHHFYDAYLWIFVDVTINMMVCNMADIVQICRLILVLHIIIKRLNNSMHNSVQFL